MTNETTASQPKVGCAMADSINEDAWEIELGNTYRSRPFWIISRRHRSMPGKREYVWSPKGLEQKRFYDEGKAQAATNKLNGIAP